MNNGGKIMKMIYPKKKKKKEKEGKSKIPRGRSEDSEEDGSQRK